MEESGDDQLDERHSLLERPARTRGTSRKGAPRSPIWMRLALVVLFFLASIALLYWLFLRLPPLSPEQRPFLKLPRSVAEIRNLNTVIAFYTSHAFFEVLLTYFLLYTFLQAFAIPGSAFLSVCSGAIFGWQLGFLIVSLACTCGASLCFLLSSYLAQDAVEKYFPEKLASFRATVRANDGNLMNYMIFLRLTPVVPNWFVNMASPIVHVPYRYFMWATFFGIMPATGICINAGLTLSEMGDEDHPIGVRAMAILFSLGCLALIPPYLKRRGGVAAPDGTAPRAPDVALAHVVDDPDDDDDDEGEEELVVDDE